LSDPALDTLTMRPADRFQMRSAETDQGDGSVLHSNLLFASSSRQFLIEFLKSRIILTINSNPHAGSH
jgi:hypothetical protein